MRYEPTMRTTNPAALIGRAMPGQHVTYVDECGYEIRGQVDHVAHEGDPEFEHIVIAWAFADLGKIGQFQTAFYH